MNRSAQDLSRLAPQDKALRAGLLNRIKRYTGIDRAIAWLVLGRILQGAGSIGTVLLIVHRLTAVEQGFYYALWSLLPMQVLFELGFSFVVLQIVAHERAHLEFHADGSVTGLELPHRRLASVLQLSVRWYLMGACVMGVILVAGGSHVFASRELSSGVHVAWQWPLRLTALGCCLTFAVGPVLSFLEGCGLVAVVARMRFVQSVVSIAFSWCTMLLGHGLFAPAAVLLGQGVIGAALAYQHRSLLLPLMRMKNTRKVIAWREEVWPFQWKIGISWLCDYFIFQLFTPILFAYRGPVESGRMGVSMSAVFQLSSIVLTWMSTKAAPFGTLVAKGETGKLDDLFFRALRQSLALLAAGSALLLTIVIVLPHVLPNVARRIVSWPVFLLLLLTSISTHIVQSEALYLRAHKVEPFFRQSIVVALITTLMIFLVVRHSGTKGVTLVYFFVLGVGGLISATTIFVSMRRHWASEDVFSFTNTGAAK